MVVKSALVTGASSGIGAQTVRELCADGWVVYAVARREQRLAALATETGCIPLPCDLRDEASVQQLAEQIRAGASVQRPAPNTIIINAGGALGADSVADGKTEDWRGMFERNTMTALNTTQAFLPYLRKYGGTLLFLTSTAAVGTYPGGAGYSAAKHAEAMIARTLRLELIGEPVRVMELCPGLVQTEEFSLVRLGNQAKADAVYAGVENPLTATDVAKTITWMVSQPEHVNLDQIIIRPVAQVSHTQVARKLD